MKHLLVNDRKYFVRRVGRSIEISSEGERVCFHAADAPATTLFRDDGKVFRTHVGERIAGEVSVVVNGDVIRVAPSRSRFSDADSETRGAQVGAISSVMPGRITRVLKKAGDRVKAGDALVVVEAMKMENEIRAPADGVIAEVKVSEGQSVEARTLLIRFE